jgi:hypothetical protein
MNISQLVDELWDVKKALDMDYVSGYKEKLERMYDDGLDQLIDICKRIGDADIEIPEEDE